MKRIFLAIGIFSSVFFFAQKSNTYLYLGYNSMCCGTPSTDPVITYIENFQSKNRRKPIEIYTQSGLGREGEFKLFIGIDALSKSKRKNFIKGLEETVILQNNKRNRSSDGTIFFTPTQSVSKENLKKLNNLTIYKKGN
ncbi:hypothetical protein PFY12_03495 [Chryseobacterium camelliae]|uniref:Uncharacterized protein n=1 Tax=Chryseobacterium camelliae TaxID=1265445 RepID=A0ABY7QQ82_9FLAO|nr:hypothetical protein [Chryseobacterium camelliae]WBV61191.1 hypothetical protein PFY12_03495 [Chryseobacterium camelliae]